MSRGGPDPAPVLINPRIIEDVHRLVDEHRASIGLPAWDWNKPNTKAHRGRMQQLKEGSRRWLKAMAAGAGK